MLKLIKKGSGNWKLLMQVLTGELPLDHPEFISWLEEDPDNRTLYESLMNQNDRNLHGFHPKKLYKKISSRISNKNKFHPSRFLKYAAAVLLLFLISFAVLYVINKPETESVIAQKKGPEQSIEPGGKKALLILEDGSSMELKDEFQLKKANGIEINNDTSGLLSYNQQPQSKTKPEYHTVKVPPGGEYELKLSDGTRVYINSGSTLRFPSFFDGDVRNVELSGEAYFEVTKNGAPFVVRTSDAEIHVLGTSFNLSAYPDDACLNATLVVGSIVMKTASNEKGYPIQPGQNLNLQKSSDQVKIETVDTRIYTAWTRGEYIFRNQNMEEILNKLSKWYDFTIEFNNPEIKKMRFTGSVEKKRPLKYFLNQIKQVTNLKFNEYGNKIEVYQ